MKPSTVLLYVLCMLNVPFLTLTKDKGSIIILGKPAKGYYTSTLVLLWRWKNIVDSVIQSTKQGSMI